MIVIQVVDGLLSLLSTSDVLEKGTGVSAESQKHFVQLLRKPAKQAKTMM